MMKSPQEQAAELWRANNPDEADAADRARAAARPDAAAIEALEFACEIEGNSRRGVWVKAYVEGEDWAIADLARWLENRRGSHV